MEDHRLSILAHIDQKTGREQALAEHSRNVAVSCGKFCEKIGLSSLGLLAGLLHDSGKGTMQFQRYLRGGDASQRGKIPHSFCGARYCYESWGLDGSVKGLTAELLAAAVCGHHGGLPDVTGVTGDDCLRRRAWPEKEINYEEALQNYFMESSCPRELNDLFLKAQQEVGKLGNSIRSLCEKIPAGGRKKAFCFLLGMVQRYLLSCLIDADRYDTFLFEANEQEPRPPDLPSLWRGLAEKLENHLRGFSGQSPIDQKRREISGQCLRFSKNGSGIYRLSVPTGSGKTLSSLRYALNCAKENGKEHVFYIAPYKSILEQNASDIRDALGLDDEGAQSDKLLLEHHSDVVVSDEEKEEAGRRELLTQRWSPPVILTTTVQFLNTLFDGKTGCVRRMHSLANSVIILDEVQAIPVKCTLLLNAALDFLAYACNCAVVLCTATQPSSEELEIPVIPGEPAQMTENLEETFAAFRRTRVVDKTTEGAFSADQLADFCAARLGGCENLLAILNTKSAAASLYRALQTRMEELPQEERIPLYFLSTSLCPQHRIDRIGAIRDRLKVPDARRMVCVSTQLIEAGVNLSFQCVIRSLAGLDSIAQAAGRCNRHGESACRDIFIVKCADENLSSLPDIQRAQEAAAEVLDAFQIDSAQFGDDPLSPRAVRRYYHNYYHLQEQQLSYPVSEKDDSKLFAPTNLFDLLSENSLSRKSCAENHRSRPPHPMHQAFDTAGTLFEAIGKGGIDVIVLYGEGKNLIAELCAEPNLRELPGLIRRAQRFTVHLFDGERRKLSDLGAIRILPDSGAAVLLEGFYHPDLGVQTRRVEMDTLIE